MKNLKYLLFLSIITASCAQFQFPNFGFNGNNQQQPNQFGIFNPSNFYFPGQQQQQQQQQQPVNYYQPVNSQPNTNFQNQQYYRPPPQNPPNQSNNRPPSQNPFLTTRRPSQNPSLTTARPTLNFNLNERISEKKCRDYSNILKIKQPVGSLSLDATVQDIAVDMCDASTGLIVGGEDAKRGEFPHQAALGYPDGLEGNVAFRCGGSLISDRFVLTAAHCKKADRVSPTVVRLGDLNLKLKDQGLPETDIPIMRFISHEKYDRKSSHNDIAVVKLDRSISQQFQKLLRPACLATNSYNLKTKAVASGWGFTEVGGQTADHLQKVELAIIDNNRCRSLYDDQENYDIDDTQLCAGELRGGKDTCQGDSGGPLQVTSDKNKCLFTIIGITSYGPTFCGSANQPGIYTRVSAYIDWIEQKVWPNQK